MENGSMFWNKITEWFKNLGLPYISEFEAMLILLAAFLVLLLILWIIFRKARLWYWKTNVQIDTLKSIDVRLHSVEEKLSLNSVKVAEKMKSETPVQDGAEPSPETIKEKATSAERGLFAVGKSGRIYTEAELELQIRE